MSLIGNDDVILLYPTHPYFRDIDPEFYLLLSNGPEFLTCHENLLIRHDLPFIPLALHQHGGLR